jgi:hypothetical protein
VNFCGAARADCSETIVVRFKALSIVAPSGSRIARGEKTIEVRSWVPNIGPDEPLVIVENERFLREPDDVDPAGRVVAILNVKVTRPYRREDIPAACATRWEPDYFSWELGEIRPCTIGISQIPVKIPKIFIKCSRSKVNGSKFT